MGRSSDSIAPHERPRPAALNTKDLTQRNVVEKTTKIGPLTGATTAT
jgi:hypothetical protein